MINADEECCIWMSEAHPQITASLRPQLELSVLHTELLRRVTFAPVPAFDPIRAAPIYSTLRQR